MTDHAAHFYPLGYSAEWEALGIITREGMERDREACERGDDPHPEHYRWRAFVRFVHGQASLAAETARRLYGLGGIDPDVVLGESIMSVVLRHDDCPADLFELGLKTSSEHLRQVAVARISGKKHTGFPRPE